MSRFVMQAASSVAAVALVFGAADIATAQFGSGTGGGTGTGLTSSFGGGQTTGGIGGGQAGVTNLGGGYSQVFGGQTGVGGSQLGGLNTRTSLTQSLSAQRNNQQFLQQNQQSLQNLVPIRIQTPTVVARPATGSYPAPAVQGKLQRVVAERGMGAPVAMWEGDTLVLSGPVANESVRRTIEGIALLTPGVRAVRNEMVIGPIQ